MASLAYMFETLLLYLLTALGLGTILLLCLKTILFIMDPFFRHLKMGNISTSWSLICISSDHRLSPTSEKHDLKAFDRREVCVCSWFGPVNGEQEFWSLVYSVHTLNSWVVCYRRRMSNSRTSDIDNPPCSYNSLYRPLCNIYKYKQLYVLQSNRYTFYHYTNRSPFEKTILQV